MNDLPSRILVGVSASTTAKSRTLRLCEADLHAAEQALWLAGKTGAQVRLVHVVDFVDAWAKQGEDVYEAAVRALDGELAERARQANVDHVFVRGLPWLELLREAHRWQAGLLVVSPRRELAIGQRLMFGRTTWRLIRKAACPVWVVHPQRGPDVRRIVALVDRTDVTERVVDAANALAELSGAERHMLHCLDYPDDIALKRGPGAKQATADYHRRARLDAQRVLEARAGDVGWELHLRDDWVARAAPALVEELDVDCAVFAAVSKPRLAGVLLGTTAETLVERLNTSCFVVRPAGWRSPVTFHDDERRYGTHFIDEITLDDGTVVTLRAVQGDDKKLLLRGFEQLSDTSRLRRFFTSKKRLSQAELRYLTELDDDNHVAIGAVLRSETGDETGIAVARFIRFQDDPKVAEPAVAVIDDMQRMGLGGILFRHLVDAARERGVTRFRCSVLPDNAGARALIAEIAPAAVVEEHDDMVMLEFDLASVTAADGPSAFRKLMALAGDGAVRIRRAFPWLESL